MRIVRPMLRSRGILFVEPRTLGARDARFFHATISAQDARWPHSQDDRSTKVSGLHPLDVRAEFAQFFVEMFVATIDMINAAHLSNSFSLQSRQHQCG